MFCGFTGKMSFCGFGKEIGFVVLSYMYFFSFGRKMYLGKCIFGFERKCFLEFWEEIEFL